MDHLAPDRTGATLELPEKRLCRGVEFFRPLKRAEMQSHKKGAEGEAAVVAFRFAVRLFCGSGIDPNSRRLSQ
jgi:hypothetical protein